MPNKRILILVENLAVPFDRRVWLEATTLRDAGYAVSAICPTSDQYPAYHEEIEGIQIYRYDLPNTGGGYLAYLREYAVAMLRTTALAISLYRRHGLDAIHGCNPPDLFFAIAWIFKPFGVQYVFDQHDLSPETFKVKFGYHRVIHRVLRWLERLSYFTADVVISTNESISKLAMQRGAVRAEDVFVVRTGPDSGRLHPVKPQPALKRGRRHLVCYLGVMARQDGVHHALEAAAHLIHQKKRTDTHFSFIGDGQEVENLKELCRDLNLEEWVEFPGRVSDRELRTYLSTADICLSPDPANGLNEFHTMNKTLEYMAMARPVVAFDLWETRVSAGEAALYAEPNDSISFAACIERLLDDPELRNKLGARGRQRIANGLGWDQTKVSLLQAYSRVFSA